MKVEHRDAAGNPTFPEELIVGTYARRYGEVPQDTELKVHVLAGYQPKSLMLVERKIYRIQRLPVRGWRRRGQIVVEVDDWRHHEAEWFNAMRGVQVNITDPALPGPHNDESDYIVSASLFDRKIVKLVDENGTNTEIQMYEGTLDIVETWKSTFRRHATEVISGGLKSFIIPVLVTLLASLVSFWLGRSMGSEVENSPAPENTTQLEVQVPSGDAVDLER